MKNKVKFVPIIQKCSYHHPDENGICKNCGDTMIYEDGYYLVTEIDGQKVAFSVGTVK